MKIIFLGTPEFAVPTLEVLFSSRHEIVAVVTQEDKERNRKKITFSPVKKFAIDKGLNVLQFEKIRRDGVEILKNLEADIMVTCAYGQILSQEIIDIAKYGIINIHGSLLPKYRGAAPIQWAVIDGEEETGITLMQTEKGIDTGDMLLKETVKIDRGDTAGDVTKKLSEMGGKLLLEGLEKIENGTMIFEKQDEEKATHARMISKKDGEIDFGKCSEEIYNFIRGMNPNPTAYFYYDDVKINVFSSEILETFICDVRGDNFEKDKKDVEVGEIIFCDRQNGIVIKTKDTALKITSLQYPNSKQMSAKDFLNGRQFKVGKIV